MTKSKSKPAKRGLTMAGRNAVSGYLFIAPFIIGFLAFLTYPLSQAIRMSFTRVGLDLENHTFYYEWIYRANDYGIMERHVLANFHRALQVDAHFTRYMTEEIMAMAFLVPAVLVFSLFIAILLNRKFVGRGFVRAVFFLPVILASGVLVGIETNNSLLAMVAMEVQQANAMRAGVTGVIEDIFLGAVGDANVPIVDLIQYVLDIINQIYNIAMASGIQILIFLAGLQTINPSIFEAASIEGATGWENFWKITFPMISPMILVVVVYSIIDFMVRTDSEVMNRVDIAITQFNEFGFGTAQAFIYFGVIAVILAVVGFIISRLVYYYD